jgi:hypothetical protein
LFQTIGTLLGCLFCLYRISFRWAAVPAKYGRLDLTFWLGYVVGMWTLLGGLVDLAMVILTGTDSFSFR